ncbi:PP2C family protein-serine/threonine phosphatase [Rubellimicrobium mesophilum]|uniref:PP2C family protein-serine/threonine phosphatase n=1 Tax=Rubellimicrobium mesophilum TaxID=1123067 RepID=UPI001FDFCD2A|nr:protein phosphatase 2C domain-containing protein [Rubellimicrobium mesophilum]
MTAPAPLPDGAGLTHRGCVRERNEDSILTDPGGTLWAIADGMGGHGHGDVASDIVIECLASITDTEAWSDPGGSLVTQFERANSRVRDRARQLGSPGMGATAVALVVRQALASVAWVGDCRAYLCRRGALRLLTRDHTLVQDLMDQGEISSEEAALHPESHVVTRAIGGGPRVEVDVVRVPLFAEDWLLLCSDGLTGCLYEERMVMALTTPMSPQDVCRQLLADALEVGAPDNVSVIAVHMRGA